MIQAGVINEDAKQEEAGEPIAREEARREFWRQRDAARRDEDVTLMEYLAPYMERRLHLNSHLAEHDIFDVPDEEVLERIRNTPIPTKGRDAKEVVDELVNDVLEHGTLSQHPRYLAHVCSAVSPLSLTGSVLTDLYNINACTRELAPGACLVEDKVIAWMCECAGFPAETAGGVFVSGGSMANFSGIVAARDNILEQDEWSRGVAYLSSQAHLCNRKGLHMSGMRNDQITEIDVDDDFRMNPEMLRQAIEADIAAGRKPYLIIATMGTTNTGAIDPLDELADIAEEYGMWLHVDGAYGGTMLASEKFRPCTKGIERADSLAWDAHKWLMQTYSCSAIIARDRSRLAKAFAEDAEYLQYSNPDSNGYEPYDLGPELSRPHRALKLWLTLQAMGTDEISLLVGRAWHMTKVAKEELEALPDWEITSQPSCGAITFRYAPADMTLDEANRANWSISDRIIADGYAYVMPTELKGKTVLRLCMINVNTTDDDVRGTIAALDACARALA